MTLSIRIEARQQQSLVMTPQLLQSIRLLQLGHQDLRAHLEREADRNPFIELHEPHSGGKGRVRAAMPASPSAKPSLPTSTGAASSDGTERLAETRAETRSLEAHASAEIAEIFACRTDRAVAFALVGALDEAGYFREDVDAFSLAHGHEAETVGRVLARLRAQAEPAGLFAADLAQCLALQLDRRGRLDPVAETVLAHLDLVARGDLATLRRLTGEDEAGIAELIGEIRRLEPKPGRLFDTADRVSVVPDVVVTGAPAKGWRVELNAAILPRVLVDERYAARVAAGPLSREERDFLSDCRASAQWLTRALDQRSRTITKVAAEIVQRQSGFFAHGPQGLKPMTLASVAEATGLHESTVSRVTTDKFMQTPRGTFEMKFFFTTAIASSAGGEAHSAGGVKHRIRRLVDAETPDAVLSDDDIAARLQGEGIEIARRTVAKYREALGIASSVQRRRALAMRRIAS
ncbi:RNA polymerase factor sigma-54 [Aureimonas mangrovi]|uniref:RNA polymerase factor sigma-54 n=1 Tax=Aureimonas mangrovi TaxID=2758041 RepID=UPI00163D8720|nr:RNA polymerase factor sigma-54 [Aureimonas mangrovi]